MSGTYLNQVSYYYECPRNQGLLGVIPVPHPLPQSVLSIQQVLRKGLRKSLLHLPHNIQLLECRNCPFKHLLLSSGTPQILPKREELPLINDSELKWGGGEKTLFSPVPENRRTSP